MEDLLGKIKERIAERDSPVKTIKAVVEAIGMSEAGFYRMVQRNTTKYATIVNLAKALNVSESYFTDPTPLNDSELNGSLYADTVLEKIRSDVQEMKVVFEEQLRVKDRQLAAKDNQITQLLELLGKPEGAPVEPLYPGVMTFEELMRRYMLAGMNVAGYTLYITPSFFLAQPVAKLVAPR